MSRPHKTVIPIHSFRFHSREQLGTVRRPYIEERCKGTERLHRNQAQVNWPSRIAAADGSQMRRLWTAPDPSPPTWMLRVSPDGKRMRFDGCEQSACALWKANTDGSGAYRLLPDWQDQLPGVWSPDGRYYVFGVLPRAGMGRWLVEGHWFLAGD